jgi:hypothetical protein
MKKFFIILTATALAAGTTFGQNLLSNSGFESGDLTSWTENAAGGTLAASTDYALTGTYSAVIDSVNAGGWASPNMFQSFAASEDDEFNLTGSMLANWVGDETFWGVIKIEFKDAGDANIEPKSVSIGSIDGSGQPYVGAISGLLTPGTAAAETWVGGEVQAVAPAGTVAVNFYLLNVNPGGTAPGAGKIYFDDVTATQVPEPGTYAAILGLLALAVVAYRRRK